MTRRSIVILFLSAFLVSGAIYGTYRLGYAKGFDIAYTAEHSHYLFEKNRAGAFEKRIANQRRCVDKMAKSIQPVESTGFFALGEMMERFGLMFRGTLKCDRDSNFGSITQEQYAHIMPPRGQ